MSTMLHMYSVCLLLLGLLNGASVPERACVDVYKPVDLLTTGVVSYVPNDETAVMCYAETLLPARIVLPREEGEPESYFDRPLQLLFKICCFDKKGTGFMQAEKEYVEAFGRRTDCFQIGFGIYGPKTGFLVTGLAKLRKQLVPRGYIPSGFYYNKNDQTFCRFIALSKDKCSYFAAHSLEDVRTQIGKEYAVIISLQALADFSKKYVE